MSPFAPGRSARIILSTVSLFTDKFAISGCPIVRLEPFFP
jgi:hypothetical protein